MPDIVAFTIVLLIGFYFVALGGLSLFSPSRAAMFLSAFAGTHRAHLLELLLRAIAGGALILNAPHMAFGRAFEGFGWLLVVTTLALALIPWRLHRDFARRTVPHAVRHLRLIGAVSVGIGAAVLTAAIGGR